MKTVNIGLVGFGSRGRLVARAHTATWGLMRTVAVVEPSDQMFKYSCDECGCVPARFDTIKEMLNKGGIDLVMIASPNECHLDNLKELDGRNIPVFIEKPLESTWEKISEVTRLARRRSVPVIVGHCMRYAPILGKAKELIQQGAIGRICSARFVQNCHYGNQMFHNWRRERKRSGTMMIEKATHDLDVMQWLLGAKPTSVFASAKLMVFGGDKSPTLRCRDCDERLSCPESALNIYRRCSGKYTIEEINRMDDLCVFSSAVDCPDDEMCLIQFDSGAHASYTQTFYTPMSFHQRDYQIVGDRGAMDIEMGASVNGKIVVCQRFGNPKDAVKHEFDYMARNHYNGDENMMPHLYAVVTGKARSFTTIEQAYLAEAIGYCTMASSSREQVVRLEEIIPNDLRGILKENIYS